MAYHAIAQVGLPTSTPLLLPPVRRPGGGGGGCCHAIFAAALPCLCPILLAHFVPNRSPSSSHRNWPGTLLVKLLAVPVSAFEGLCEIGRKGLFLDRPFSRPRPPPRTQARVGSSQAHRELRIGPLVRQDWANVASPQTNFVFAKLNDTQV